MKNSLSALLNNFSKKAFTLAEVLITMGIIGIVAEMTIPTLAKDINDMELRAVLQSIWWINNIYASTFTLESFVRLAIIFIKESIASPISSSLESLESRVCK